METTFKDIEQRLTEAALVAEHMTPEEICGLFAEAARAIQELLGEVEYLRSNRDRFIDGRSGGPAPMAQQ